MAAKMCRLHVVQTVADDGCVIVYGVDQDGFSRTLHVAYSPCFYIRAQENHITEELSATVAQCAEALSKCEGYLKGESSLVRGRRFTYWEPQGDFWQARFKNDRLLRKAAKSLAAANFEIFQGDLDPVVRFYAERDMDTHGVLEVNYELLLKSTQQPVAASQVKGLSASCMPNKSVIAYYDIETFGAGYRFPCAREQSDVVFNVCTVFRRMCETVPYMVTMHAVGTYEEDAEEQLKRRAQENYPGCAISFKSYKTEHEMLSAWCTHTGAQSPAYMFAHNGMGFDLPYLFERCVGWNEPATQAGGPRASVYKTWSGKRAETFKKGHAVVSGGNTPVGFHKLGRPATTKAGGNGDDALEMRVQVTVTAAHGQVEVTDVPLRGVVHVDSLLYLRKFHSYLDQLGLDFLAKKFLGEEEGKDDVTPAQLHDAFVNDDSKELTRAMLYCFKDVDLLVKLDAKLSITVSLPVYGSVFCVPSSFIQTRGQTVRVVGQCVRTGNNRKADRVFVEARPAGDDAFEETSYEGAKVITPKKGWYHERPVSTLDFASLYPSLMMAYFICPTLVLPAGAPWEPRCGFEVWHTKVATKDENKVMVNDDKEVRLVVDYEDQRVQPLMPNILGDLKAMRKGVKAEMEAAQVAGDVMLEKMLDAKQLGIKTSMNSMYGFLGASSNHLALPELAALVTQMGRESLCRVQRFLEEQYPSATDVIYGDTDSVMIHMLDIKMSDGRPAMERAFETGKRYAKEASAVLRKERAEALFARFQKDVHFVPLSLEFEKIYWPYLLVDKKMYAAGKYESLDKMKLDIKGFSAKRRTVADVVRSAILDVLNNLMKEMSSERAVELTMEKARLMLEARVTDLGPYEFSKKLSHAYKTSAACTAGGKEVKVKVEVHYDGRWKVVDAKDWDALGVAPPEGRHGTHPCTHPAYQPWTLEDGAGKQVGRVTLTQPHLHAALAQEERMAGKGPRPGDRVRYVVLNKAHPKAQSTVLSNQAAYAYCLEDARDELDKDESASMQVSKYYAEFVSGTSAFMDVVCPGTKEALAKMGDKAMEASKAVERQNKKKGTAEDRREAQRASGQRSVLTFFAKSSGTWAPSATAEAKRAKKE